VGDQVGACAGIGGAVAGELARPEPGEHFRFKDGTQPPVYKDLKVDPRACTGADLACDGHLPAGDVPEPEWPSGGDGVGRDEDGEQVGSAVLVLERDQKPQLTDHRGSVPPRGASVLGPSDDGDRVAGNGPSKSPRLSSRRPGCRPNGER